MKIERVEANDDSGDFAIIIYDDNEVPIEIQEFDKQGTLKQRAYAELGP